MIIPQLGNSGEKVRGDRFSTAATKPATLSCPTRLIGDTSVGGTIFSAPAACSATASSGHATVFYDFTTINLHRRSRTLGRQEKVGVEAMTNHLGGQPPGELEQRIGLRGQPVSSAIPYGRAAGLDRVASRIVGVHLAPGKYPG